MRKALLTVCGLALSFGAGGVNAQTNVAPEATEVLANACRYLAECPFYSITAEVWREHVTESGQKLQFTRVVNMEIKRPNRLHVEIQSSHSDRAFWYNGQSLSILDRKHNFYSATSMPGNLDVMVDNAHDRFGIDLPLVDLALSDPYKNATSKVQHGFYLGLSQAMGYKCHHLAFTQENIDWQVWIQDGPQPLIRKFVITHKNEPGAPEFTALIRDWNLTDRIADSDFVFVPLNGASKIEMKKDEWTTSPENFPTPPSSVPSSTGR